MVVIGDDPYLLAQATTILARKRTYLALLDGPRVHRPDLDAEVIRRNNAVARLKPHRIILAGLPTSTCDLFSRHFPNHRTQRIVVADELLDSDGGSHARSSEPLRWGKDKLGLGVLRALRAQQRLAFDDSESPRDSVALDSSHVVVCEEGNEHAQVLAANYAYSLDAGLCLIPAFPTEEAQALLESLYTSHENRSVSATALLEAQSDDPRDREEERGDTGYHDAGGEEQTADAKFLVHGPAARTDQQRLHEEQDKPGGRQGAVRHNMKRQRGDPQPVSSPVALEKLSLLYDRSWVLEEDFEKEAGGEPDQRDREQDAGRRNEESMMRCCGTGRAQRVTHRLSKQPSEKVCSSWCFASPVGLYDYQRIPTRSACVSGLP